MSYWNNLGLLRKDKRKCFQVAFLVTRSNHGETRLPFNFCNIQNDEVINEESIVNFDYDRKTKAIFTYNYRLPFVNGARVEFKDGTSLVISRISEEIDEAKAQADGKGIIGLNLYFGG